MYVKLEGDEVREVKLRIYEPPRFFEAFLRGRAFTEAPDITARICGICPVAYQMSAVRAMEDACGVTIDDGPIRDLRRLLYCGEWIESHSLHVYMLHAPDFLGYAGRGRDGARPPRDRRAGAADEEGRQRARWRWSAAARCTRSTSASAASTARPRGAELRALRRPARAGARDGARDRALGRRRSPFPDVRAASPSSSRCADPDGYPIDRGRIVSDRGLDIAPGGVRRAHRRGARRALQRAARPPARARHLPHRSARALQRSPPPRCARWRGEAAREAGLGAVCRNPFQSIVVRAVELVQACDEALAIIDALRAAGRAGGRGRRRAARSATARPRRRAACSTTATRSTTTARSSTRGSCRRPRRTSSRSRRTSARSSSAASTSPTRQLTRALRAGDPQPRPLHLLRDALPRAHGRA